MWTIGASIGLGHRTLPFSDLLGPTTLGRGPLLFWVHRVRRSFGAGAFTAFGPVGSLALGVGAPAAFGPLRPPPLGAGALDTF